MIVSIVALLCSMNRTYVITFLSTKNSNTDVHELFTKNEEDESLV